MFDLGVKDWLISGLVVTVLGGGLWSDYQEGLYEDIIDDQDKDIISLNVDIEICKINNTKLGDIIEDQNDAVEIIAVDMKQKLKELNKWKIRSDKYKYRFTSIVDDINITRGNCEDNKLLNDSLNGLNLNGL